MQVSYCDRCKKVIKLGEQIFHTGNKELCLNCNDKFISMFREFMKGDDKSAL